MVVYLHESRKQWVLCLHQSSISPMVIWRLTLVILNWCIVAWTFVLMRVEINFLAALVCLVGSLHHHYRHPLSPTCTPCPWKGVSTEMQTNLTIFHLNKGTSNECSPYKLACKNKDSEVNLTSCARIFCFLFRLIRRENLASVCTWKCSTRIWNQVHQEDRLESDKTNFEQGENSAYEKSSFCHSLDDLLGAPDSIFG